MKDRFSNVADDYATYRPHYPRELFEFICSLVSEKELAWDCGTGNGQTAGLLSGFFEEVYATDISSQQINKAVQAKNIRYAVEPAERISLIDGSVNLTTVSQALHWFNVPKFYEELRRVSKPGSVIAAWAYGLFHSDAVTEKIIQHYYFNTLNNYWDAERAHVDDGYAKLPFPFKTIHAPEFSIQVQWNLQQLRGYLNTWSAVQHFMSENNFNPVDAVINEIEQHWPREEVRPISFPLHLKIGWVF